MDKASKALRRSSVRLRSFGSGHGELNLVISELKEVRNASKTFLNAQHSASQELLRWAQVDENKAIQETFFFLNELHSLWADVQKDFTDHLKEFKIQFDLILEGEKHVDQARTAVALCDQRECKLRKDLKKCIKKGAAEEIQDLEKRMCEASRVREVASLEVDDRIRENEAVKLIRVKASLMKLSEAYVELANKCKVIFEAHRDVANQLPDVHGKDLQDIVYTGHDVCKRTIAQAKERAHKCSRQPQNFTPCAPHSEDPPPPYSVCPPFNPAFLPSYNVNGSHLYVGPSTSYDVPDGPMFRSTFNSSSSRSAPESGVTQRRAQSLGPSAMGKNNRHKRKGLFFRSSMRRNSESRGTFEYGNDSVPPTSEPGPSRSTNPFDEENESEAQGTLHSTPRPSSCHDLSDRLNRARLS